MRLVRKMFVSSIFKLELGHPGSTGMLVQGRGGGGTRGFFGFEIFDSRIFLGIWQEFFLVA